MKLKQRLNTAFFYVAPFLMAGVMAGVVHTYLLTLLFIPLVCTLTRHEAAFVFSFIVPPILGLVFNGMHIGIPGSAVSILIAFALLGKDLLRTLTPSNMISLRPMVMVLLILGISLFWGGMTEAGLDKYSDILFKTLWAIVSVFLLTTFHDIKLARLAPIFLLTGLMELAIGFDFYLYMRPSNLYDFEAFRESTGYNKEMGLPYLTYHSPAISAMVGMACRLASQRKIFTLTNVVVLIAAFYCILASGARQGIVGGILVVCCWIMICKERFKIGNLILILVVLYAATYFLQQLDFPFLQQFFEQDNDVDKRLNRNWDFPLSVFSRNMAMGVGLGNYFNPYTNEVYPHNIVLELLCETGLFGTLAIAGTVFYFLLRNRVGISHRLADGSLTFLFLLPYITRSLISVDLRENTQMFVLLFVLYQSRPRAGRQNVCCNAKSLPAVPKE